LAQRFSANMQPPTIASEHRESRRPEAGGDVRLSPVHYKQMPPPKSQLRRKQLPIARFVFVFVSDHSVISAHFESLLKCGPQEICDKHIVAIDRVKNDGAAVLDRFLSIQ